jgi:hypothetical protein
LPAISLRRCIHSLRFVRCASGSSRGLKRKTAPPKATAGLYYRTPRPS